MKGDYKVYMHIAPNGKKYIGMTKLKPKLRWNNEKGYTSNDYFFRAILKYGWDNIKHEILFSGLTKGEAEQKEIELIAKYKSNEREYGYNIDNGGNTNGTHSKETIEKIRNSELGEKNPFYGKKHTMSARLKISRGHNGKPILCIETKTIYCTVTEASKLTGVAQSSISRCCLKIRNKAGGYHWEYVEDKEIDTAFEQSGNSSDA